MGVYDNIKSGRNRLVKKIIGTLYKYAKPWKSVGLYKCYIVLYSI